MAHTYTSILYHLVFSTKDRIFAISEPAKLWAYIAGISKNLQYDPYAIGGTGNHVHALIGVPPMVSAAEAVQKLKANSSRWLREQGKWPGWQEGYGAFSVSGSNVVPFGITFRTRRSITGCKRTKRNSFRSWNGLAQASIETRSSISCRP